MPNGVTIIDGSTTVDRKLAVHNVQNNVQQINFRIQTK